ncbi:uncharacterized protein LOC103711030 [Phoenix dactylifera]|uniref:Uncharacterized protein LOC103711030 n=1 Tax=Phoenix dactylifera TaxID=42345 RepID=A0A8B7CAK9_PHODC|nr:uncharacterized protein LOC103711030 [Phoenix dactylifera]
MRRSTPAQDRIPTECFSKRRGFPTSTQSSKCSHCFLITLITFLALLQIPTLIQAVLKTPLSFSLFSPSWPFPHQAHNLIYSLAKPKLQEPAVTFLPLKDLRLAKTAMEGNTWFMSSLNDTYEAGETEFLHFPSKERDGRLLCLAGSDPSNGTRNSYTLAPPDALPRNAKLLSGLTYVSDTYYDYDNLWHGLSAVVPFVAWHRRKGCVRPARWVLYHRGELRTRMGPWVAALMKAVFGQEVAIERFEKSQEGPICFEEAVVFRHNEGSMARERREEVYDMMRCKARAYCGISTAVGGLNAVRLTLLLRTGARSFKDEPAVIRIFGRECMRVDACQLKVARPNNLTFCDQVKLLSETDILASTHGAQLTNMFFMDKNSSLMEFFPKGWLELAGVGQYVFRWIASYSGMKHQGAWNDPQGDHCPHNETRRCFSFYKDRQLGHDETFFANWTARVLNEVKEHKLKQAFKRNAQTPLAEGSCQCS